jgi:hypothetical protein
MNAGTRTFETENAAAPPAMVLPAIVGFFFSFRLFNVLLAVRIFQADAQTGIGISLGLSFLLLGIVAFHSLVLLQEHWRLSSARQHASGCCSFSASPAVAFFGA